MLSLKDWILNFPTNDNLWKGALGDQLDLLLNKLAMLIGVGFSYEQFDDLPQVISTHKTKSLVLPVVSYSRPDLGLRFIVRGNFRDWKLSVISDKPLDVCFDGLFHTTPPVDVSYTGNPLSYHYFEGFPGDLIFGYYSEDQQRFSACISDETRLWAAIFLILRSVGAIGPLTWATEERFRNE